MISSIRYFNRPIVRNVSPYILFLGIILMLTFIADFSQQSHQIVPDATTRNNKLNQSSRLAKSKLETASVNSFQRTNYTRPGSVRTSIDKSKLKSAINNPTHDPIGVHGTMIISLSLMVSIFMIYRCFVTVRRAHNMLQSRHGAYGRENITIAMLSRLLALNRENFSARDAAMLRIALTQRDFNENDYEILQQLDESKVDEGCNEYEIERLPEHLQLETTNRKCSICLGPFEVGDRVRTIPCLHSYHKDCIDEWLRKKAQCPICKSSVTDL